MKHDDATHAFATLGHAGRLAVFRLLMRFAPRGVRPTEIAKALGLKPNTLSHHVSDLMAAGLVQVTRQGRSLFYKADQEATRALIGYLVLDVGRARPNLTHPLFQMPNATPAMSTAIFNVLFICTRNSARSIFAEALLRDLAEGRMAVFSAGVLPNSALNPAAIDVLVRNGHDVAGLRAKHLSEFQGPDAPVMDFVFTVCDTAAAEECPPWPGQPITGHWGLPDPAQATGTPAECALAFAQTYAALRRRIAAFVALPFDSLGRVSLQTQVDDIDAKSQTPHAGPNTA